MTRRVLVTRPEPGASSTARRLRDAGFHPVVLPLTEIRPLDAPLPGGMHWDAVAVTSANALRHASTGLLARLPALPAYAVGEATAAAARAAGFLRVEGSMGDATSLAETIAARVPERGRVLYLCGRVRKPDLERALDTRGIHVDAIETYDTVRLPVGEDARSALGDVPLDAVIVHSAESAGALAAFAAHPGCAGLFAASTLVAISSRAAAPASALFAGRVRVAREPTDAAMVEALRG